MLNWIAGSPEVPSNTVYIPRYDAIQKYKNTKSCCTPVPHDTRPQDTIWYAWQRKIRKYDTIQIEKARAQNWGAKGLQDWLRSVFQPLLGGQWFWAKTMIQYGTIRHSAIPCQSTRQSRTVTNNRFQHNPISISTMQRNDNRCKITHQTAQVKFTKSYGVRSIAYLGKRWAVQGTTFYRNWLHTLDWYIEMQHNSWQDKHCAMKS